MSDKRMERTKALIDDMRAGVPAKELINKHHVSEKQLKKARELLHEKRRIKVSPFLRDVRAPISDFELMNKYELTAKQLHGLFRKLIRSGAVAEWEIYKRLPELQNSVQVVPTRRHERCRLGYELPIYDEERPDITGWVQDLSDYGLRSRGIRAGVDEVKTLIIPANEFSTSEPVMFSAICRWAHQGKDLKDFKTGFEIVNGSDHSLEWIRETIRVFTFGD